MIDKIIEKFFQMIDWVVELFEKMFKKW